MSVFRDGLRPGSYGVAARFLFERNEMGSWFATMTWSFLTLVPLAMGFLTVRAHPNPSLRYRLLAPWIPITLTVLVSWAVGWEGAICIVMAYPILLITGSFGGLLGGWSRLRPVAPAGALILIPWLLAPVEARWHPGPTVREVETAIITIHAPAEVVWRNVIEVPAIAPAEVRPALFTRMGFPRPISATLTGTGVGAIRHALIRRRRAVRRDGYRLGSEHRLSFIIRAQTDSIPPSTLDPHVTIGGNTSTR